MDADLFGDTLSVKKKGSIKGSSKGSKNITPRSNSVTPRSAAERVASPTRSETPTSPPSSARGSLKRKPVKPSSSTPSPTVSAYPPGTAPGKMTGAFLSSECPEAYASTLFCVKCCEGFELQDFSAEDLLLSLVKFTLYLWGFTFVFSKVYFIFTGMSGESYSRWYGHSCFRVICFEC